MGRPFASELSELSETYSWVQKTSIEGLANAVSASAPHPLVVIGSGGSFSAAHLASTLHQHCTGNLSRPFTPLEFLSSSIDLRSAAVMMISAGGSNSDILSTFEYTIAQEPRRFIVFCLRKGSALARKAQSYNAVDLIVPPYPSSKDGFLATNSLLAFSTLLIRAYDRAFSLSESLPSNFDNLVASHCSNKRYFEDLQASLGPLCTRKTLVALYGPSVSSAAVDLESKFSEAAIGNVQLADFRNFAHGRHHWLAKRESETAILAIYSQEERVLAERTLRLIPGNIPTVKICLPHVGLVANVAALVAVFYIVGAASKRRKIDPGRPGVPLFGRRIYSLRAMGNMLNNNVPLEQFAIARKLKCSIKTLEGRGDISFWEEKHRSFVRSLDETSFGGILFDYDGTLCDERDRFKGVQQPIIRYLLRLLQSGTVVGIATGRGRSVREDLRKTLPKKEWHKVYLGYYNGANISDLCDDNCPSKSEEYSELMRTISGIISKHPIISTLGTSEARPLQVSVQPKSPASAELLWRILQQLAQTHKLRILKSGHSIDIGPEGVSKLSLLKHLEGLISKRTHVLVIGDKGQWPGNDYDLLSAPNALSVDEVSADPNTCWNLTPPGYRGAQGTLAYLKALSISGGKLSFSSKKAFLVDKEISG